jgi:hypothetical protein
MVFVTVGTTLTGCHPEMRKQKDNVASRANDLTRDWRGVSRGRLADARVLVILVSPPIRVSCSVEIMRPYSTLPFLLILAAIGCDATESELTDLPVTSVQMDLGALVSVSQHCQSIVSEVQLRVDGEFVGREPMDLGGVVTFDSVRVPIGSVLTEADVISNKGVLIFSATGVSAVKGDGFKVNLKPEAVAPVLEVCIRGNEQQLVIWNKGRDAVKWQLMPQGDAGCLVNDSPCLQFAPPAWTTVTTVDSDTVAFSVNSRELRSFDVLISSQEGDVGITIDPVLSRHRFWSVRRVDS